VERVKSLGVSTNQPETLHGSSSPPCASTPCAQARRGMLMTVPCHILSIFLSFSRVVQVPRGPLRALARLKKVCTQGTKGGGARVTGRLLSHELTGPWVSQFVSIHRSCASPPG